MRITESPELKHLVTFVPNRREPIHNWYWYKEGFSKALVDFTLNLFKPKNDSIVLDPFCGVGTTNLACKQRGIQSIGFDVNPLSVLVSKVKTADYDLEELSSAVKEALSWKFTKPKKLPADKYLRKAFSRANLEYTIFYKEKVAEVENPLHKEFLLLALIDASTKGSWTVKDGALLKIRRGPVPPVGKLFKYKIKRMLRELKKNPMPFAPARIGFCDARSLDLGPESIDFVITSPPYLNKIEYSKIYRLELSLFFGLPPTQIRSFLGARVEDGIEKAYWTDMEKVLSELYRACKYNAKIAWVVGGGCFPDHVVETDVETAKLAESIGFKTLNILAARHSWCTARRTIKIGKMRESVVLLEKV